MQFLKLFFVICCLSSSLFGKISVSDDEVGNLTKEEIKIILKNNNFNPDQISNSGDTVVHLAVKKNDLAVIKLAVAYGVDLKMPNKAQDTPLHLAAERGNLSIATYLIEQGSSIFWINLLAQTPYHKALQNAHQQILDYFIQNGYIPGDELDDHLIALGYNPAIQDNAGNTILHKVAQANDIEMVGLLIENGWNINSINKLGKTPLMLAVAKGHTGIVHLLIENEAEINLRDNLGNTCLIIAIKQHQNHIVNLLLSHEKINLDILNTKGISALHYAVADANIYVIHLLLERGANSNLMMDTVDDSKYWSPADWDAWGDADSAGGNISYKAPSGSPLAIAHHLHPENTLLSAQLTSYGAKYYYYEHGELSLSEYLK
ncbi:MAG: ankyrin repeat domain-containing protein [Parachlamydiaceae bacterium]|nr:ankyrin repeat domain-containing protein [Parachlamydiaceae bacterium]